MGATTEERLVELESRLTEQERTIEQLNDVLVEQGHALDRLAERVRTLQDNLAGGDATGSASEPPPPHY